MILIFSTRPPHEPDPSRSVTWSRWTVPTDGQARATALAAELDELRVELAAEEDLAALLGAAP